MIRQRAAGIEPHSLLFTTWSPVVLKKYHDRPRKDYSISSVVFAR